MSLLANKKDIVTRYGNRYTAEEWELKKQLEAEDGTEREPTTAEKETAKQEFITTLTAAGIEETTIAKLAALGGMGILSQYEREILRFSSPEREALVVKAANAWCRKLN